MFCWYVNEIPTCYLRTKLTIPYIYIYIYMYTKTMYIDSISSSYLITENLHRTTSYMYINININMLYIYILYPFFLGCSNNSFNSCSPPPWTSHRKLTKSRLGTYGALKLKEQVNSLLRGERVQQTTSGDGVKYRPGRSPRSEALSGCKGRVKLMNLHVYTS